MERTDPACTAESPLDGPAAGRDSSPCVSGVFRAGFRRGIPARVARRARRGGSDDLVGGPLDPVRRVRGPQSLGTGRLVDLVHGSPEQLLPRRGPFLSVKLRPGIECTQEMGDAVCLTGLEDLPVRFPEIVHRNAGRVRPPVPAAFAETELAGPLRTGDVDPVPPTVGPGRRSHPCAGRRPGPPHPGPARQNRRSGRRPGPEGRKPSLGTGSYRWDRVLPNRSAREDEPRSDKASRNDAASFPDGRAGRPDGGPKNGGGRKLSPSAPVGNGRHGRAAWGGCGGSDPADAPARNRSPATPPAPPELGPARPPPGPARPPPHRTRRPPRPVRLQDRQPGPSGFGCNFPAQGLTPAPPLLSLSDSQPYGNRDVKPKPYLTRVLLLSGFVRRGGVVGRSGGPFGSRFVVDMPVPTSRKCHQLQERPL